MCCTWNKIKFNNDLALEEILLKPYNTIIIVILWSKSTNNVIFYKILPSFYLKGDHIIFQDEKNQPMVSFGWLIQVGTSIVMESFKALLQ